MKKEREVLQSAVPAQISLSWYHYCVFSPAVSSVNNEGNETENGDSSDRTHLTAGGMSGNKWRDGKVTFQGPNEWIQAGRAVRGWHEAEQESPLYYTNREYNSGETQTDFSTLVYFCLKVSLCPSTVWLLQQSTSHHRVSGRARVCSKYNQVHVQFQNLWITQSVITKMSHSQKFSFNLHVFALCKFNMLLI